MIFFFFSSMKFLDFLKFLVYLGIRFLNVDFHIQYNITISNTFSTILCSSTYLIYVSIEVSVSTQQQKMGALNFQQAIGTYRLSSDGGGGTYKAEPCNDCTQNSTSSCGCRKGKFVLSTSTAARLFPAFH